MALYRTVLLLVLALSAAGCSLLPDKIDETEGMNASELYALAKEELNSGNYQSALDYFSKLEARYPYGRYAQQAQLETAYAHYRQGEPAAAVAAAERFIKLHPRHPNVDYAYYLRGLASFDPGRSILDRVVSQEKDDRDPQAARDAFNYFRELVTRFPNSKYTPDAVQRMTYLRNSLASYELLVADYYLRRGAYVAAANRAKYVIENYDRTPAVADALVMLVHTYHKMDMPDLADDALRVLEANYPERAAEVKAEQN